MTLIPALAKACNSGADVPPSRPPIIAPATAPIKIQAKTTLDPLRSINKPGLLSAYTYRLLPCIIARTLGTVENVLKQCALPLLEGQVGVYKIKAQGFGKQHAHRAFARAGHTDEDNVSHA